MGVFAPLRRSVGRGRDVVERVASGVREEAAGEGGWAGCDLVEVFEAEAGEAGGKDADGGGRDFGEGKEMLPVCGAEGAAERDRAVVACEGVPAEEGGEQAVEAGGAGGAGEVVDEPAEAGGLVLPAEHADDPVLFQVVHEKARDDEVRRVRGGKGEGVCGKPEDGRGRAQARVARGAAEFGLTGEDGGLGVEIDAGEIDGNAADGGPASDADEGVSAAGADIENAEGRLRGEVPAVRSGGDDRALKKAQGGPVAAGELVDLLERAKTAAKGAERTGGVHELGEGGGGGAVEERVGHEEV